MKAAAIWDSLRRFLTTPKIIRWRNIPVIIIVRDRVTPLKQLVEWLEDERMQQIILVDNDSTYPPLLEYLEATPHEVIRLGRNVGHLCPWLPEIASRFEGRPYIVSDSDVVPDEESHGAVKRFAHLLNMHPTCHKAGFGLHIDDLPDAYASAQNVREWEAQWWRDEIAKDVFFGKIDTTFALYRAGQTYTLESALRTGGRFQARHTPWYVNSADPDEETLYYEAHASRTISTWFSDPAKTDGLYTR